jgi:hypothetical protein
LLIRFEFIAIAGIIPFYIFKIREEIREVFFLHFREAGRVSIDKTEDEQYKKSDQQNGDRAYQALLENNFHIGLGVVDSLPVKNAVHPPSPTLL